MSLKMCPCRIFIGEPGRALNIVRWAHCAYEGFRSKEIFISTKQLKAAWIVFFFRKAFVESSPLRRASTSRHLATNQRRQIFATNGERRRRRRVSQAFPVQCRKQRAEGRGPDENISGGPVKVCRPSWRRRCWSVAIEWSVECQRGLPGRLCVVIKKTFSPSHSNFCSLRDRNQLRRSDFQDFPGHGWANPRRISPSCRTLPSTPFQGCWVDSSQRQRWANCSAAPDRNVELDLDWSRSGQSHLVDLSRGFQFGLWKNGRFEVVQQPLCFRKCYLKPFQRFHFEIKFLWYKTVFKVSRGIIIFYKKKYLHLFGSLIYLLQVTFQSIWYGVQISVLVEETPL